MEKVVNFFVVGFIGLFVLSIFTPSCDRESDNYNVNVQTMVTADEGLDLKVVGSLLKKAKTTEEFEKLLNSSSTGVNNLDLNEDGTVDYIKVTEYGDSKTRGYSLTTEPTKNDVQEIATIEVEKTSSNGGQMQVRGNQHIYGHNHYYHSRFTFSDYLVMRYLWGPSWGFYRSPYHWGYRSSYYRPYRTVTRTVYRNRTSRQTSSFARKSSSSMKSTVSSPNKTKTASSVKAPLKNPSRTQKSFQARNPSKQVRSGGFGRSSSSRSSSRRPSVRSGSRSGGSFRGK